MRSRLRSSAVTESTRKRLSVVRISITVWLSAQLALSSAGFQMRISVECPRPAGAGPTQRSSEPSTPGKTLRIGLAQVVERKVFENLAHQRLGDRALFGGDRRENRADHRFDLALFLSTADNMGESPGPEGRRDGLVRWEEML